MLYKAHASHAIRVCYLLFCAPCIFLCVCSAWLLSLQLFLELLLGALARTFFGAWLLSLSLVSIVYHYLLYCSSSTCIPVEWKQMTYQPCQIAVLPLLPRWFYRFDASKWIGGKPVWGDRESPLSRVYSSKSISFPSTGCEGKHRHWRGSCPSSPRTAMFVALAGKFRIYFGKCISIASSSGSTIWPYSSQP